MQVNRAECSLLPCFNVIFISYQTLQLTLGKLNNVSVQTSFFIQGIFKPASHLVNGIFLCKVTKCSQNVSHDFF